MNRKRIIDEIATYFARFVAEIQVYASLDLTDINKISEDVLVPILATVYGYHELKNLNTSDWYNFPAVDLGDDTARVAIQVTSQTGSSKAIETLRKFKEHGLSDRFGHLIIYVLGNKTRLTSHQIDSHLDGSFTFDKESDYRDHSDILQTISGFDNERLAAVRDILEANFGDRRVSLSEIEDRLDVRLSNQLTRLRNSRKYIPRLFVEVSETKDKARYFVHPLLFFNKAVEDLNRLHFKPMNRFLEQLSLEPVSLSLTTDMTQAGDINELDIKSLALQEELDEAKQIIQNHYTSWYEGKATEDLPEHLVPLGEKLRFALGTSCNAVQRDLEKLDEKLKLLRAKVLFLISRAGQGKTNFVCDLAENVMAKRSIPTIFMTGQELSNVAPEDFSKQILKEAFAGDYDVDFMLDLLDELGARKDCPVTIIIDGINEHTELTSFSQHLERFAEEIVKYPHLKLILTCREEYFEERFSNFRDASFNEQIVFLENFNLNMSEKHKRRMVESYFEFFRLNYSHISTNVVDTLQSDTLLLRMFCESYGNPESESLIDLQQVHDIYRYEIFQRYRSTKLDNIVRRRQLGGIGLGAKIPLESALDEVIRLMVDSASFANLKLNEIDPAHLDALGELVSEDVILRVDLSDEQDPYGNRYEVLNFTFDEFRDYLVAHYLVNDIFRKDPQAFQSKIAALIDPSIPIAEGLKKYIFFASRQRAGREVENIGSIQNSV